MTVCADYASAGQCQWDNEELMLIERFFEAKVCGCNVDFCNYVERALIESTADALPPLHFCFGCLNIFQSQF